MSDAPERIWAQAGSDERMNWWKCYAASGFTPYIRADLAGLPEELVGRIRTLEKNVMFTAGYRQDTIWLMRAILTWHEQRTGGGNDH
jgi:hypothetical protein